MLRALKRRARPPAAWLRTAEAFRRAYSARIREAHRQTGAGSAGPGALLLDAATASAKLRPQSGRHRPTGLMAHRGAAKPSRRSRRVVRRARLRRDASEGAK